MKQPTKQVYIASYEDRTKADALARNKGLEDNDNWFDILGPDVVDAECQTRKEFKTLDEAIAWTQAAINAENTVFGCGDVDLMQWVPINDRCQYCTCRGWNRVDAWIVDDEGFERNDISSACYSDE